MSEVTYFGHLIPRITQRRQTRSVTRILYLTAKWCARHALLVIAAWLIALIGLNGINNALPPAGQQDFSLAGTDSAEALTLLSRAFPGSASDANPLVISGDNDLSTGAGLQTIKDVERAVGKIDGVAKVEGPQDAPKQYSEDNQTAIINVTTTDRYIGSPEIAQEILDAAQAAAPNNIVALGGLLGSAISSPSTQISEVLGLLAAVIVLLLALRRAWAAAIPLSTRSLRSVWALRSSESWDASS